MANRNVYCARTISANKKTNIKRHDATKHREFTATFPLGSLARHQKLDKLQKSLTSSENMLVSFTPTDKRATEASLRVSKILAKTMLPYFHAEIVKECMVEAMERLFPDKRDVVGKVKAIPLSRKTATGKIESINDHLRMTLLTHIDQADYFSIAIDESTDIMDVAQLAVFVRFFDGEEMKEALLTLVGLERETTSQATYDALVKRLDKLKIPL
ncbi:SCAN domain-containing protein 3-like [Watersipora subatra]|uniref:SCAN domain-containing protein 3-like n=1 Tax=Watersipora subatra TaxID=2589382 RepID=UPI00355BCE44